MLTITAVALSIILTQLLDFPHQKAYNLNGISTAAASRAETRKTPKALPSAP